MLAQTGMTTMEDLIAVLPSEDRLHKGPVAIFECFQKIPCNPCAEACPQGVISFPDDINECPILDSKRCNGCGVCLSHCPGLSIFIVDYTYSPHEALLKIPYEFSPVPETGTVVAAIDRTGAEAGVAHVIRVQQNSNKTCILWLVVPKEMAMRVRNIRERKQANE